MTKESIKQSVMKELESGSVKQTATWVFVLKEYGIWFIAGVTIVFGTVSMAIIFASVDDLPSTLYALQTSGFKGVILFMPYLWIVGMISFFYLGYNHIRKTKQGYRYPLFGIMGGIIVVSCLGGGMLYATGFATHVDGYLAERVEIYRTYGNPQHAAWRSPLDGRLAGVVVDTNTSTCEIRDVHGAKWLIELTSVTTTKQLALTKNMHIRVVGERTASGTFYAREVWVKKPIKRIHHKIELTTPSRMFRENDVVPTDAVLPPADVVSPEGMVSGSMPHTSIIPPIPERILEPLEVFSAR